MPVHNSTFFAGVAEILESLTNINLQGVQIVEKVGGGKGRIIALCPILALDDFRHTLSLLILHNPLWVSVGFSNTFSTERSALAFL